MHGTTFCAGAQVTVLLGGTKPEDDPAVFRLLARQVQDNLNQAAGIGLKAQAAPLNTDRVNGIIAKICAAESFDKAAWVLGDPVRTFSQSVVDDTLERNARFQYDAGLSPKVVRKAEAKACKWCRGLEGTYEYPKVPADVYRRHENCRCTVEYDPGGAKKFQNVHTKRWKTAEERGKIKTEEVAPYQRPNVQKVKNSVLPNGLPIKGEPSSVVDKVDDFGNVLQRREYGENGLASTDFDTSDHGLPHKHPTGAHKHIFDYQKKKPRGVPLALTEHELNENADIIQRGVNYRDPE